MTIVGKRGILNRVRDIRIDRDIVLVVADTLVDIARDRGRDYLRKKFEDPKTGLRLVDMVSKIARILIRKNI